MKTAKRVLAIIVSIVMIVGTCAVAVSATDPTLQEQINAGQSKITLYKDTYETITVNRDLEIDLNGYRLLSEYGKNAIKITAGDVKIYDGQVISRYENITSYSQNLDKLQEIGKNSPSAIKISGGTLEVEGVRIVGGMIRVPYTTSEFVPTGSAIQSSNNVPVTIKRSSLYGDYGVNNKVTSNNPGGLVTIEDAIILAYTMAIKGGKSTYAIANGSEEIDAADRLKNITFSGGIPMEDYQEQLIDSVIDERVIIVTKKADTLAGANLPKVTVTEGNSVAALSNFGTLDYTWANTKGTDCSYKLVPEAFLYEDGTSTNDFNSIDANKINTADATAQTIRYRVEFKISDEAKPYIESILAVGEDNPLDGCLAWVGEFADVKWNEIYDNETDALDSYWEVIEKVGDLLYTLDTINYDFTMGDQTVEVTADNLPGVPALRKLLAEIGGKVAWENSPDRIKDWEGETYNFSDNQMAVYGLDGSAADFQGTLDRVNKLVEDIKRISGGSFTKTENWGKLAKWLVVTAYPELIGKNNNPQDPTSIMNTLIAQLDQLYNMVTSDEPMVVENEQAAQAGETISISFKQIIEEAGMSSYVQQLGYSLQDAKTARDAIVSAFDNNDVMATITSVQAYGDDIVSYVDEAVAAIEDWRTYIDPTAYVVENNTFVKTYATYGSTTVEKKAAPQALTVYVLGSGTVTVTSKGTALGTATESDQTGKVFNFSESFTLTATPEEGYEFLFWANKESGSYRILSTEASFTMNTNTTRFIEAVFNEVDAPVVYLTSPTGDIAGMGFFTDNGGIDVAESEDPVIPGYTFIDWPSAEEGIIPASAVQAAPNAYFAGSASVFANPNAFYGENGAILAIRPGCKSMIVTPKFARQEDLFTVSFWVNGVEDTGVGRFSDVATKTAAGCYWTVKGDSSNIVCVNPTFTYWIYDNGEFEAVEGACPVDAVAKIVKVTEEDGYITFYAARSSSRSFTTTGLLFSARTNDPKLNSPAADKVSKSTAKFNTKDGMFSTSFAASNIGTRTIYLRPYIEYSSGEPFYGPVYTYQGHYAG